MNIYPWDTKDKDEAFWQPVDIQADRWNQMFPYRLLVIDITKKNKIYGSGFTTGRTTSIDYQEGVTSVFQVLDSSSSWEFRLPITPQQLKISDRYSISTTATARGVIEEHNGLKFKKISASGTTGIFPNRQTIGGLPTGKSSAAAIFSGTIGSFNDLIDSASSLARAASGSHPASVKDFNDPADTDYYQTTGYFQAQMMGQFIERYVQLKKKPEHKNLRLVFDIPKQNKSFIVTPNAFDLRQSEQSPNESLWSFELTAWKRIDLKSNLGDDLSALPISTDLSTYQTILNTLDNTRSLLGDSLDLVKSVRSDFQNIFNVLRQTSLIVKDLAGVAFAIIDLPKNIIEDAKSTIEDSLLNIASSFERQNKGSSVAGGTTRTTTSATGIKSLSSSSKAGNVVNALTDKNQVNEGLSASAVANGALGEEAAQTQEVDSLQTVFQNPEENFELFNSLTTDSINLNRNQQEAIDRDLEEARLINIDELKEMRETMLSLALDISNSFGGGDSSFSATYGRSEPSERVADLTIEENDILMSIYNMVQSYDLLTSSKRFDNQKKQNPMQFTSDVASSNGISFDQTENKYPVPVPFGLNIEQIAARYLKDSSKFIELATLNNLKSPYIDEDGYNYTLSSNGDGRQFNVDDSEGRLYVGQTIYLKSSTVPEFSRKIIAVEEIGEANFLITVDGDADLDSLRTADGANMQGYLAGTLNSQNKIYIPTTQSAGNDDQIQEIPEIDYDQVTKMAKVDWLLDDSGDIAINSVGDFRYSTGLTNLIQAFKLKIRTKKGTLLRHLDYGIGLNHGISVSDLNNGNIIEEVNAMIREDARFESIDTLEIILDGTTLSISMTVNLPNQNGVVPVTFDVKL